MLAPARLNPTLSSARGSRGARPASGTPHVVLEGEDDSGEPQILLLLIYIYHSHLEAFLRSLLASLQTLVEFCCWIREQEFAEQ